MASKPPNIFSPTAKGFRNLMRRLPMDVSLLAEKQFKQFFVRGGYVSNFGFVKWKARATNSKRNKGRAVLTQSGKLKRSITAQPQVGVARVISAVPYAQVHNEGFKGTQTVKAHKRNSYTSIKVQKTSKSGKTRNATVQQLKGTGQVKAHTRRQNIPARPFMVHNGALDRTIQSLINKEIDKIWNNI